MPTLSKRVPFAVRSVIKIVRARAFELLGSERYLYPALGRLDRQMIERLPSNGTFLEIGANDGYTQSNTYFLERRRGWRGVLVEPLPRLLRICRWHRRRSTCYNVACVAPGDGPVLSIVDHGLRSVSRGLVSEAEERRRVGDRPGLDVPTATLSDLITRSGYEQITFMSVDVEGAELHVLGGLDLDQHTPRFLLVETAQLEQVQTMLAPYMVCTDKLSDHDYLFEPST